MQILLSDKLKGGICVDLWDKFFASGKISDYLKYKSAERGENDADAQRSDPEGEKHR